MFWKHYWHPNHFPSVPSASLRHDVPKQIQQYTKDSYTESN